MKRWYRNVGRRTEYQEVHASSIELGMFSHYMCSLCNGIGMPMRSQFLGLRSYLLYITETFFLVDEVMEALHRILVYNATVNGSRVFDRFVCFWRGKSSYYYGVLQNIVVVLNCTRIGIIWYAILATCSYDAYRDGIQRKACRWTGYQEVHVSWIVLVMLLTRRGVCACRWDLKATEITFCYTPVNLSHFVCDRLILLSERNIVAVLNRSRSLRVIFFIPFHVNLSRTSTWSITSAAVQCWTKYVGYAFILAFLILHLLNMFILLLGILQPFVLICFHC